MKIDDPVLSQHRASAVSELNRDSFSVGIQQAKIALQPFTSNGSSAIDNLNPDSERSFLDAQTTIRSAVQSVQSLLPPPPDRPLLSVTGLSTGGSNGTGRTSVVDDIHNVPPKAPTAVSRESKDREGESTKYHILVVDDSPLNRKMLTKLLKSKGHR